MEQNMESVTKPVSKILIAEIRSLAMAKVAQERWESERDKAKTKAKSEWMKLGQNEVVSSQTGYFDPDNTQFEAKLTPSREDAVG